MRSRWRWRAACAIAAGLGAQLWALPVLASDLSWSGPPECNASEQLVFQVERALGAPLARVGQLQLQVHVERVAPDARARLRIGSAEESRGGTGSSARPRERRLAAPDCARLVDTLAVAITLALEAEGSSADATTEAAESAGTASSGSAGSRSLASSTASANGSGTLSSSARAPVSEWNDDASSPAVPAASAAARPAVTARIVADSGSLPKPALGMALGVRVVWPRVQLEALGTVWLSQRVLLAGSPSSAGGDVSLATGALRACVHTLGSARSELSSAICAGGEIGRRAGTGLGVQQPLEAHALWLAPSLDLGLSWRVPRSNMSLGANVGAAAPLERQRFVLDGLGQVHQPAALAARAALSLDVVWE